MTALELKTHWKKLHNPNYLGSWDFQPGEVRTLTIKSVTVESVRNIDGKSEDCQVIYWKQDCKPLICNVTNAKVIEKLIKSPYIQDWIGSNVSLRIMRVKAFGDMIDAVRVDTKAPVGILQDLNPAHPKWNDAAKAIKDGKTTIEAIRNKYNVTESHIKMLQDV